MDMSGIYDIHIRLENLKMQDNSHYSKLRLMELSCIFELVFLIFYIMFHRLKTSFKELYLNENQLQFLQQLLK